MNDDSVEVAVIPKNAREVLRINLETFKDLPLLNVRVWVAHEGEPVTPTKSGFGLKAALIPALRDALAKAEVEAQRLGWLPDAQEGR